MGLKFAACPQCHEEHAVRANGELSIHQTAQGERCTPPPVASPPRVPRPSAATTEFVDEEREAAFDLARTRQRMGRRDDRPDPGLDRRIYAVGGAHVVRGGLPTLGRGRTGK